MRKIRRYFTGVAEEAHRVRWPSSKELWKAVGIVLALTIICALVLLLSDYLALEIMKAFNINVSTSSSSSSGSYSYDSYALLLNYFASFIGGMF